MRKKALKIQHRLNPLHIHCRLVERGMNKRLSYASCIVYELFVFPWLRLVSSIMIYLSKKL